MPASQRIDEDSWYQGTADAVYQNIDIIEGYAPKYIVILAGDHIYKMDYEVMLWQHVSTGADITLGCIEVPRMEATGFGVMHVDEHDRIIDFIEKPADPPAMPDNPDMALASMGIYVFETKRLLDILREDAANPHSSHDFGKDIVPNLVKNGKAIAHRFTQSCVTNNEKAHYWRDVGTVDAYWEANIDLTATVPELNLYDQNWPIWTYNEITAPAKFVHDEPGRRGEAISSMVSGNCIISGASLHSSLLFTGVKVRSFSTISHSVILPQVIVGRHVRLSNVVVDRGVMIPDGMVIGEDPELDAKRFRRTDKGICLVTQNMINAIGQ